MFFVYVFARLADGSIVLIHTNVDEMFLYPNGLCQNAPGTNHLNVHVCQIVQFNCKSVVTKWILEISSMIRYCVKNVCDIVGTYLLGYIKNII